MSIDKARQAKHEKYMQKSINTKFGILSVREFIERLVMLGYKLEEAQEPTIKWSRIKFNRLDYDGQKAYEKRIEQSIKRVVYAVLGDSAYKLGAYEEHAFLQCKLNLIGG